MSRASWDETWLGVADIISKRSLCDRAQIGCVIVDAANRVIATGYNGPPAKFKHGGQQCLAWCPRAQHGTTEAERLSYTDCPSNHAEANALMMSERRIREGGTIYVTGPCCITCCKLIANSGLSALVVRADDDRAYAYREASRGYKSLIEVGLTVIEVRL